MQWLSPTHTPGPTAPPTPCYDEFHTIADELDAPPEVSSPSVTRTPIPWRYYAPSYGSAGYIWSAFDAIERVRGNAKEWKQNVISPSWQILKDIPNGVLDNVGVVWVVPNYKYSDHAGFEVKTEGPSWVGDVVNAIGKRTKLWNNSVVVVLWDDWGGWYDNASPPSPDFRGEGIRTPMLISLTVRQAGPRQRARFAAQL